MAAFNGVSDIADFLRDLDPDGLEQYAELLWEKGKGFKSVEHLAGVEVAFLNNLGVQGFSALTILEGAKKKAKLEPKPRTEVAVDEEVCDALFRIFSNEQFSVHPEPAAIRTMLFSPLCTKVPTPSDYASDLKPMEAIFEVQPGRKAMHVFTKFVTAVIEQVPSGRPSELQLTSFWSNVGIRFPELALQYLHLPVGVSRNVEDDSITTQSSKRDLLITLEGVLCVGGEDKTHVYQLQEAVNDCLEKHRGANAALYGSLEYILMLVTAGTCCGVYVMPVGRAELLTVIDAFEVGPRAGRLKMLHIMVNITRWLRTVHVMQLLPPRPPLDLLVPTSRPSPYAEELDDPYKQAEVTMHLRVFEKRFYVPAPRVQSLLDVYGALSEARVAASPHVVTYKRVQVGKRALVLQHPMEAFVVGPARAVKFNVRVEPVGAQWYLKSNEDLQQLFRDLVSALSLVHQLGFVHRDVRADNIVRTHRGYMLIDWELAGQEGEPVFWNAKVKPPGVEVGTPWKKSFDLWQLGRLLESQSHVASEDSKRCAEALKNDPDMSTKRAQTLW